MVAVRAKGDAYRIDSRGKLIKKAGPKAPAF